MRNIRLDIKKPNSYYRAGCGGILMSTAQPGQAIKGDVDV